MSSRPRILYFVCALLFSLVALVVLAGYAVHTLYAAKARLLLEPTHEHRYAQENAALRRYGKFRVVVFGDSRVALWEPSPELPDTQWVWRGIGGETTRQMMHRFGSDVVALQPDAIVLQAGINDLVAGAAAGRASAAISSALINMQTMARQAVEAGSHVIVLNVVRPARPPIWRWLVWSRSLPDTVDALNTGLGKLAGPKIDVIDADALLSGDARYLPSSHAADTLHFNPAAYAIINQAVVARLQAALRSP